jgi:hypothetical protein
VEEKNRSIRALYVLTLNYRTQLRIHTNNAAAGYDADNSEFEQQDKVYVWWCGNCVKIGVPHVNIARIFTLDTQIHTYFICAPQENHPFNRDPNIKVKNGKNQKEFKREHRPASAPTTRLSTSHSVGRGSGVVAGERAEDQHKISR